MRPNRAVGDKGYIGRAHRAYLRWRSIRYTIPHRRTEYRGRSFDHAIYRERNRVEHLIGRCKQVRSVATRYDIRDASYQAWQIVVSMLFCLKAVPRRPIEDTP